MAEQVILVCDLWGRPATRTTTLKVDARNLVIDVCDQDHADAHEERPRASPRQEAGCFGGSVCRVAPGTRPTERTYIEEANSEEVHEWPPSPP
jgi:hypothetical protein